jgi:hypothetical protein
MRVLAKWGRVRALGALLAASTTAGCFRYTEVPVASLQPGTEVRAQLTGGAVERLRQNGRGEAKLLDDFAINGRIERLPSDSVVFAVDMAAADASRRGPSNFATVALSRGEVRRTELRQFDRRKSMVTGAVISAAAVVFATYAVRRGGKNTGTTVPPVSPPESRVPLTIRWHFP